MRNTVPRVHLSIHCVVAYQDEEGDEDDDDEEEEEEAADGDD